MSASSSEKGLSADPGLCQGRGGAWDHRRCGTWLSGRKQRHTPSTPTCPCHLFFRTFKTAVCPPSNPPNAPAGLQGNNSYSYMPLPSVFQGVQDCRLPALKPPKRFRRPPRQQLLQLHAPAICFSGGSTLPFARPQTPETLPQASKATTLTATCPCHLFFRGFKTAVCLASNPQTLPTLPQAFKATTLTATCPCHLFFRGFKTAVCPPSNPPNAPAGLQGNNSYSYSYVPLPSVFQGVQDCRLPALKPPNAPAGLQGNNSYSYMPLPSVFQGVQDCRLPALKPPKRSRRPPRQQLLQLHAPAICFSGGSTLPFARNPPNASASVFQGVQDCRFTPLKPPKRFRRPSRQQLLQLHVPAILGSRLPFARPQTPQRQQLLQLHVPAICFSGGSRLPFARPQTPQTLPQACKATTLTATCPCHLFFKGFKTAVSPPSNPPNAPAGLQGNNSYSYMSLPSVFQGCQDCRLPALKPPKRSRRPPRQQLLQLHVPAICFSGGSRLPFARPQTPQTLPQASKATTLTATCPCHLFFRGFKTAVCLASNPQTLPTLPRAFKATTLTATCPCHLGFKTAVCPPSNPPKGNNSYSYMSLPSVFQGVQDCRLPALKPPKRSRRPPRQQLLQLHAPAICFSRGSRLPFPRPQTPQTLPQASKATTLTATCPCHLFFRGFKTAVCPPSNPPNAPAGLQGNNSYSYMSLPSVFQGVQDCRLPALKPPKRSRRPPRQQLLQLHVPAICFSGGSRLQFAWPQTPKRFQPSRRPSRQQLLQLHAPAICFSGGSRLPFARPQTPETLPQASKATTLTITATCPCHLFFRGFKTAVCPPSNPPNAPAGLQGNNSYSYMPLPSVFQGVQDPRMINRGGRRHPGASPFYIISR